MDIRACCRRQITQIHHLCEALVLLGRLLPIQRHGITSAGSYVLICIVEMRRALSRHCRKIAELARDGAGIQLSLRCVGGLRRFWLCVTKATYRGLRRAYSSAAGTKPGVRRAAHDADGPAWLPQALCGTRHAADQPLDLWRTQWARG